MNETILLVGHGSRNDKGNEEIEQFTARLRERCPQWHIELCFIEFADPLLDAGLDRAAANAQRVIVAPLILNAAGHVKIEIPEHIEQARQRHPEVEFLYAAHLGAEPPLLQILMRRLCHGMQTLAVPDPRSTSVILLGRGSSDAQANGELAKMARWLQEQGDHELVEIAFTGITHPRLERVVQRHTRLGMGQIIVLPYYLFTGTLIERIHQQVERLRNQYPRTAFALEGYFGFEDEIFQLLEQRVREAMAGDVARFERDFDLSPPSGHHHHHSHHHHHD